MTQQQPPVFSPKSVIDHAVYTTVRIEVQNADNSRTVGTGFFFSYGDSEQEGPVLLFTNKHLVSRSIRGSVTLRTGSWDNPNAESFQIDLDSFRERWIGHTSGDIDLCALPLTDLQEESEEKGLSPWFAHFGAEQLPTADDFSKMYAAEDILMIGYPIGLWDKFNNFPFVRRGITATPPAVDFQCLPFGFVDTACVPGSSGSPILIVREPGPSDLRSSRGFLTGAVLILLGIHDRKVLWTENGKVEYRTQSREPAEVPAHLGRYIKAREIEQMKQTIQGSLARNHRKLNWEDND